MRLNFLIFQIALITNIGICSAASQVAIRMVATHERVMIPALDTKGTSPLIALPVLCENIGYSCQWNRNLERLTCTKKGIKTVFVQGCPFYTVNGAVFQISRAPLRIGGSLYLPMAVVMAELKSFSKGVFQLDTVEKPVKKTICSSSKYSVMSVATEKKQNGTLLTLVLADSLPFEFTYFYPNLTINFSGGTVDTHVIRQTSRIGLVDTIFALQYKQSAQVSLILNREIEEPLIDYIEDTRTLFVALRQKKVKPAVATPKKNESSSAVVTHSDNDVQSVMTIVLDAGHGGKDPGATGNSGILEKDVVLDITLKVRDLLKKQNKLKVLLTRDKDIFIPLSDRTKFANEKKADLFMSVHADAVPGNIKRKETARGYKIYFLSQAKNEDDKLVAMRENAVIELEEKPQNYSSLQNVLIDLAGNEFLSESQDLCILLDQKLDTSLDRKITKLHLGVGQANFWVLNGAYMPSVLIETGFLSNPSEEKFLSDKKFQNKIALAIYEAIIGFRDKFGNGL
jgi:N-acetylmuramoyl-L-alanine amidase